MLAVPWLAPTGCQVSVVHVGKATYGVLVNELFSAQS